VLATATATGGARAQDEPPVFDERGRQVDEGQAPPPEERIRLPEPIEHVEAPYPAEARAAGIEGTVILKLTIDAEGRVVEAAVDTAAGHGFDEAALDAVRRMRFRPARRADGTPFKAIIRYRYRFHLGASAPAQARWLGVVRGRVLAREPEGPLAGAAVELSRLGADPAAAGEPVAATHTGADGSFVFEAVEPGSYRLRVAAAGHEPLVARERLEPGGELGVTYRLSARVEGVIDVTVEGDRPPREVTRRSIERREIERIPGTNGDALRSIQSLPGVARPPGILGVLLIRGSSPLDSQTFIDGSFVPLIYHFGGLSSVVPTELVSRIDFYPGNFSARYGRAQGGIVDAGLRSPRGDGYHGLAQVDLIDVRLMAEGPIPWLDGWTFAAAGRRSWLDAWLGPVLEEAGAGVTQAPRYYDYQFLVEHKTPKQRFRTAFFGSDDALEILLREPPEREPAVSGNAGLATAFQRLHFLYEREIEGGHRVEAMIAPGRDDLEFGLGQYFFLLEVFSVASRFEYSHKLARAARLNAGLDIAAGAFDVTLRLPAPPQPGQPPGAPFTTRTVEQTADTGPIFRPAAYVEMELSPDARTRIVPGVRLDYALDSDRTDVSPRLNARYLVRDEFPKTTAKGGIGVFHQPPQFQQVLEPLGTPGLKTNRAIHYGLGVEQEITRQLEVSLEGFFKQLDDQVIGVPATSGAHVDYQNRALGYAAGAELLLKYKPDKRFFGWLAYTLSRSARQNGPEETEYLVPWDQTHILTVLGSYRLGHGWEIGARFRLVSGNLTTPQVCDATAETCDPNRVGALFHAPSGAYTPIPFGAANSERLPLFHQLDVRVDKAWQFEAWKLSAYLDVQNAYNQQNVEGIVYNYNFTERQFITGIPILPSIGLRGEF
jgi:TonB family protein